MSGKFTTEAVLFKVACQAGLAVMATLALSTPNVANAAQQRPNIIMIVVDTLRYNPVRTVGNDVYPRDTTPTLYEFSQRAHVFTNAISAAPWTLPSYTSMFSGMYAFNHNMNEELDPNATATPDVPFLSDGLKDAGYSTVSIQTNSYLNYLDFNFDETYHYMNGNDPVADEPAVQKVEEWLDGWSGEGNFFLAVGLFQPHWTYYPQNDYFPNFLFDDLYNSQQMSFFTVTPVSGGDSGAIEYEDIPAAAQAKLGQPGGGDYYHDSRVYHAAYDAEVRMTDDRIKRVFDKLKEKGLYEDSIIIFTADHGENMAEHEPQFAHGGNSYSSLVHVPLMIKLPQQKSYTINGRYVRGIDVMPTVFDYLSLSTSGIDGKSLLPVVRGGAVDYSKRPAISYRLDVLSAMPMVSLHRGSYHLMVDSNGAKLFNVVNDPDEQSDLSTSLAYMVDDLKNYIKYFYDLSQIPGN